MERKLLIEFERELNYNPNGVEFELSPYQPEDLTDQIQAGYLPVKTEVSRGH